MQTTVSAHGDCSVHEPCEEGKPDACPLEPIRQQRAAHKSGFWSALVMRKEPGGLRHYLDGKPVHCGEGLDLQHYTNKSDEYGDYSVPDQYTGPTRVRYEASQDGKKIDVMLYADVGGHEFTTRLMPWMRFKWPKRSWE